MNSDEYWDRVAGEGFADAPGHFWQPVKPPTASQEPSIEELEEWDTEGGCEATDGCWVEPDGHCEHGHPSWLLKLGMI